MFAFESNTDIKHQLFVYLELYLYLCVLMIYLAYRSFPWKYPREGWPVYFPQTPLLTPLRLHLSISGQTSCPHRAQARRWCLPRLPTHLPVLPPCAPTGPLRATPSLCAQLCGSGVFCQGGFLESRLSSLGKPAHSL